jgi:branched-subunit amino acid transport protein
MTLEGWPELVSSVMVKYPFAWLLFIPFILIKKKIQNKFIKSFLYYVPYTVLAVMTIPSALLLTNHIWTALLGLCVAAMLALKGKSLTIVAVAASVVTLIAESLLLLF